MINNSSIKRVKLEGKNKLDPFGLTLTKKVMTVTGVNELLCLTAYKTGMSAFDYNGLRFEGFFKVLRPNIFIDIRERLEFHKHCS